MFENLVHYVPIICDNVGSILTTMKKIRNKEIEKHRIEEICRCLEDCFSGVSPKRDISKIIYKCSGRRKRGEKMETKKKKEMSKEPLCGELSVIDADRQHTVSSERIERARNKSPS